MFSVLLTYGKAAYTLLWLARKLVELGEKNNWIEEGERRFILQESLAVNKALKFKNKVMAEKMTPEDVLRELDGQFRD